jgi:hypothetical protein
MGILSKINGSKNLNMLWNNEQMRFVILLRKDEMVFQGKV